MAAAAEQLRGATSVAELLSMTAESFAGVLDAPACTISRVIGDLLVGLDEHTTSGRPLAHGHEYLISDFPLTREVVEGGEPRWVSRLDTDADEQEATLLSKLGFESLLMVCLPSGGSCWGLVELYLEHGHFDPERAELAARFSTQVGTLLERLEPPETV